MLREKGHELAYPDNNSISEQHRLRHVLRCRSCTWWYFGRAKDLAEVAHVVECQQLGWIRIAHPMTYVPDSIDHWRSHNMKGTSRPVPQLRNQCTNRLKGDQCCITIHDDHHPTWMARRLVIGTNERTVEGPSRGEPVA